jgi:DNA-binding CsgD family transcriptional regulator/sugar-specific transcriptional regulator TrmB
MSATALHALGLGPTAEAVYRIMLTEPVLGVAELARRLSLPESEVRTALDELLRLTLLRESHDSPGQWRVVQPEVGLEAIIRRQEEELAKRQQELAASKARVAEAIAEFSVLQPSTGGGETHRLVGLDAIHAQLEILARRMTSECLSVMPGGAQSRASLDASRTLDQDALERAVRLSTLYQDSMRHDLPTFSYAKWLTQLGGQVRTAPILPPRMLIFDNLTAIIPIDPGNTRLGALCTSEPAIIASLVAIFKQAWTTALPLEATPPAETDGLTASEVALLRLLASGLTDEAAGRKLGTSARTVRRQVAGLMERLGATSRFEAGLKARQHGWL